MPHDVAATRLRTLIQDYLAEARIMQLATVADNRPWCCNVWFAADNALNIYWYSSLIRRHSIEVNANPNVAGAVVLPHTPADAPRGIQFEGAAEQLTADADITAAKGVYVDRIFPADKVAELMESSTNRHAFYRVTPSLIVLFDAVNFPDAPRQELHLRGRT